MILARRPTCHPSRRRARPSTSARTSGRSASCSTKCCPAGAATKPRTSPTRSRPCWKSATSTGRLQAATPPRLSGLLRDCLVREPRARLRDMGEARRVLDRLREWPPHNPRRAGIVAERASARALVAARPAMKVNRGPGGTSRAASWKLVTAPPAPGALVTTMACHVQGDDRSSGRVARRHDHRVLPSQWPAGVSSRLAPHGSIPRACRFREPTAAVAAVFLRRPTGSRFRRRTARSRNSRPAEAITLTDGSSYQGASGGDDDTIVYSGQKGLLRLPASGNTPESLTTTRTRRNGSRFIPQFLPGGRQLLFTVVYATRQTRSLPCLGNYKRSSVAAATTAAMPKAATCLLSVQSGTLFALPFNLDRL